MQCCYLQGSKFELLWEYELEGVYRINPKGCSRPTLCVDSKEENIHLIVQAVPKNMDIQVKIDSEFDGLNIIKDNKGTKNEFRDAMMKMYQTEDNICEDLVA